MGSKTSRKNSVKNWLFAFPRIDPLNLEGGGGIPSLPAETSQLGVCWMERSRYPGLGKRMGPKRFLGWGSLYSSTPRHLGTPEPNLLPGKPGLWATSSLSRLSLPRASALCSVTSTLVTAGVIGWVERRVKVLRLWGPEFRGRLLSEPAEHRRWHPIDGTHLAVIMLGFVAVPR